MQFPDRRLNYLTRKADSLWQEVSQFQISPQDVAAGSHPNRSVPIPLQCSGSSVAGGVFWLPDTPTNMQVNGETVGAFLA
ncbi:hypothetical protein EW026_g6724 [Hermanssonia centrifuga]|uniref:Uncharacterized protein n=1 Tax=Hermanssonia centrifuga TaxID=98765 RepID=A0A4V3X9N0_9APHY|nr:hypothetical protein EW026_g6724 [Hermanssonia centrifuga]